jgi:hypothetical protein
MSGMEAMGGTEIEDTGLSGEVNRTSNRVRTAMAAQTRQGRYLVAVWVPAAGRGTASE